MDMRKITPALLALLALLAALSSFAAIPVKWTTDTFKVKPLAYECYHGETLNLAASLTSYGEPLHLGGKTAHLYFQTDGMGDDWYITNATVAVDQETGATNVLSAIWSGEYDTGKDRVTGFIGVEGENYRASFVLTLRASPGFEPSDLPLPTKEIDCAKVVFKNATNAPFASEGKVVDAIRSYDETNLTARLNAKQGTLTAGENITIDANNVISATGGGGGGGLVNDVKTNGVSIVANKVADIYNPVRAIVSSASVTNAGAVADAEAKYLPLTGGREHAMTGMLYNPYGITIDSDTIIGPGVWVYKDALYVRRAGWADAVKISYPTPNENGTLALTSDISWGNVSGKPTFATVATSGSYNDLSNKPTIPAAQIQSNWNETDTSSKAYIQNKPTLASVATSGSYNDLSDKPNIGQVATNAVATSDSLWSQTNTKLTNTIVGVNLNYLTNANSRAWSATSIDNSVIKRIDNLEAEIVGVNALLETALGGNN